MGIPLSSLSEGCCEELNSLPKVKLDEYKVNKSMSSVDNILECDDKYIFIEEKSFLLDYYRLAGKRCNQHFHPINGEIPEDFLRSISKLDKTEKKELMYKACFDKALSHDDKLRDTMTILYGDDAFCNIKTAKSITVYLYCKGVSLAEDENMSSYISLIFSSKIGNKKLVECNQLSRFLEKQKCS